MMAGAWPARISFSIAWWLLDGGGIRHHALEILALDSPRPVCHRKALLQERRDLLLTQPLAPAHQRRTVSHAGNTTSPQKYWKYGFSTNRPYSASSERLCMGLRMNRPATGDLVK
jgi:hypothetical protein